MTEGEINLVFDIFLSKKMFTTFYFLFQIFVVVLDCNQKQFFMTPQEGVIFLVGSVIGFVVVLAVFRWLSGGYNPDEPNQSNYDDYKKEGGWE